MAATITTEPRPLLLATAGHVDHGKSTLVKILTGVDPDRLPQEKTRGMTLDLGFVNTEKISFVDCPGHEGLVRHTIAGHNGIDGALFIVDLSKGLQEQSFEHARILKWLHVKKVLLIITKCDLAPSTEDLHILSNKIIEEVPRLFDCDLDYFLFSKNHDPGALLEKIESFFSTETSPTQHNFDRFFIDRSFTLKGVGTLITGSLTEGHIKVGDKVKLWTPQNKKMKEVLVRSLRRGTESTSQASTLGRLALVIDGAKPKDIPRGSLLLFERNGDVHFSKNFALNMDWACSVKSAFSALLQVGTLYCEVALRKHPLGFWRAHSKVPLPLRRHDPVIVRVPQRIRKIGCSIGGGKILDGFLPDGKIKEPPPNQDALFIKWAKNHRSPPKTIFEWMDRLGHSQVKTQALLGPEIKPPPVGTIMGFEKPLNKKLFEELFAQKWRGFVATEQLSDAHQLVKKGLAYHIGGNHFLHYKNFKELLYWLNKHFEKKTDLKIEDAREFFGSEVGRKTFLAILEFCDRNHFTFRKGNGRKSFKLPSYSHPFDGRP
jgi:selenocysteine-specific translation elongation factor